MCIMKKSNLRMVLICLLVFLAIGGLFGGIVLTISPSGQLLKLPLDILKYSPFNDFLIPGIFLLVFMGILPIIIAVGLFTGFDCKICKILCFNKKRHWSINFSMYVGIILMLFETIQVILFRSISFLHIIYFILGVVILILSCNKHLQT